MEGLSLQSRMARIKLNTTLKLLKSSTIRTAEKIKLNKKEVLINESKTSWICVLIFYALIFITGIICIEGLHLYFVEKISILIF